MVCRYDTIGLMRLWIVAAVALAGLAGLAAAQAQDSGDPVAVVAAHPRIFLDPPRLRLLTRERTRESQRWRRLEALVDGGGALPEPGFALALYYQITGDASAGRKAVAWALGARDLRQMALVFDWCQGVLDEAQKRDLGQRMVAAMTNAAADQSTAAVRDRALAAVALYDEVPDVPGRELNRIAREWWSGNMVAKLRAGRSPQPGEVYPLFELLHAIRAGANLDLREEFPDYFVDLPIDRLMSYYPAPVKSAENDYWIGSPAGAGSPDLRAAMLSRAADLAMAALDPAAQGSQMLQGWLMHNDRFTMRDSFGAPYEFLWTNQYQPGLNYQLIPLTYYDAARGRLFVRSSWDDSADWLGCFDGAAQKVENGRRIELNMSAASPQIFSAARVYFGRTARTFRMQAQAGAATFIAGLDPGAKFRVEITGVTPYAAQADRGGLLKLQFHADQEVNVRLLPVR